MFLIPNARPGRKLWVSGDGGEPGITEEIYADDMCTCENLENLRWTCVGRYVIVNPEGCGRDVLLWASSRVTRAFGRSILQDLTNRAGHSSRCSRLPRTTVHRLRFYLSIVSPFRRGTKLGILRTFSKLKNEGFGATSKVLHVEARMLY